MNMINKKSQHAYSRFVAYFKKTAKHPFFPILVLGVFLILLQVIGSTGVIRPSLLNFISPVLIRFMVALGFMLLLGYAGLASLGTAGFMGLGSYLIGYLFQTAGMPAEVAFLIGIAVALFLGVLVGFISLRVEGMYLAIVTLGLSEILKNFFVNSPLTGGSNGMRLFEGIKFIGIFSSTSSIYNPIYYLIVIFMIVSMVWILNIINSPTGRAMLSIKNSTSAAQAMGISILKYRLTAFLIATLFAVTAGMLQMVRTTTSYPNSWGIDLSLNVLAAVVIGGTKNIWGVLIGTFIVFGLKDIVLSRIPFFQTYNNAHLMFSGILIILVVMFYPGGVVKLFGDLINISKKIATKLNTSWKEYRYGKEA
ncbi:MAG: branched-chain amino acid ABC transporter permease [Acholeplasmataceae bacterium]|nr:branched-chain amino acid ABC transporter permease [Acholeplasmataceae bacterium]